MPSSPNRLAGAIRRAVAVVEGGARAVGRAVRDALGIPTGRTSGSGAESSGSIGGWTSSSYPIRPRTPPKSLRCHARCTAILTILWLPSALLSTTSAASISVSGVMPMAQEPGAPVPPGAVVVPRGRETAATLISEDREFHVYREPLWSRTYCPLRKPLTGPHFSASETAGDDCADLEDSQCQIAADRTRYTEDVHGGVAAVRVVPPVCEPLRESLGVAGPPGLRYSCGYFFDTRGKFTWDRPFGDWPRYAPCGVEPGIETVVEPCGPVLYVYDTRGHGVDVDGRRFGGDEAALFRLINRGVSPAEVSVRVGADAARLVELPGVGLPWYVRGHCACAGDLLDELVPRTGLLVHARPPNGTCSYVTRRGSGRETPGAGRAFPPRWAPAHL